MNTDETGSPVPVEGSRVSPPFHTRLLLTCSVLILLCLFLLWILFKPVLPVTPLVSTNATLGAPDELPTSGMVYLQALNLNPVRMHAAYIPSAAPSSLLSSSFDQEVLNWLDLHVKRYGIDDNFTLRVIDSRDYALLERVTLELEKSAYEIRGQANWNEIDQKRQKVTRDLVNKYVALGIPRGAITVKWGRLNQTLEARIRDEPYLSYELQLAQRYGLSAMATELGTVETFNRDDLISSAGARGRYQFMPAMLRQAGVHNYTLQTTAGQHVRIYEEQHPLLIMEHAFALMRAYANVVGHELPGLSAYQAGPANLLKLYRLYLEHEKPDLKTAHVADAYLWGLTQGFSTVRKATTFGHQSRGYVASAYGAFQATAHLPINLEKTLRAESVSVHPSAEFTLLTLLNALDTVLDDLDWGSGRTDNLYENFRRYNPHLPLDSAQATTGISVPEKSNLIFRQAPGDQPKVRLFLPLGTAQNLTAAGHTFFDITSIRRFDEHTFKDPALTDEKTSVDVDYETLVADIGHFGFTPSNQNRLFALTDTLQTMAQENPTPYRQTQAFIAYIHKTMWRSRHWTALANALKKHKATALPIANTPNDETTEVAR